MASKKQDLLDEFAISALNALISKMPFYDAKGEHGKVIDESELQLIKKGLASAAYEYAGWMMIAREDSKKWLEENEKVNPYFGG